MAISFIGSANGTTSVIIPAHQVGDLLILYMWNSSSSTTPSGQSGWTNLDNTGVTGAGNLIQFLIATTNTTTVTLNNTTNCIVHVYRSPNGCFVRNSSFNGGAAVTSTSGTGTSFTKSGTITTILGSGTSWIITFQGHKNTTNNLSAQIPTGTALRNSSVNVDEIATFDSNGATTSPWNGSTSTLTGTAAAWRTVTAEIREGQKLQSAFIPVSNTFKASNVYNGQLLSPGLFQNNNSFSTPNVLYSVNPSFYQNTNSFYSPQTNFTINQNTLSQNTNTFYNFTITQATVLQAPFYQNTNNFYSIQINQRLSENFFQNSNQFFAHNLSVNIKPSFYNDPDSFFSDQINLRFSASLYNDPDSFYIHQINVGAVTLNPTLYQNNNQFFTHTLSAKYTLSPSYYQNTNTFYNDQINLLLSQNSLYQSTNVFYSPSAGQAVYLDYYDDPDIFFGGQINSTIIDGFFQNVNRFYSIIILKTPFKEDSSNPTGIVYTPNTGGFGLPFEPSSGNSSPPFISN